MSIYEIDDAYWLNEFFSGPNRSFEMSSNGRDALIEQISNKVTSPSSVENKIK